MMELRRLTMVNWHLFDVEEIDVWGSFGILGENRSGKSTVLDMVQVVLSGASRSYLRLNAVAGESGRSRSGSRRSVHSYCLGALGDGEYRRPRDTLTYIAIGFEDVTGEREPVTIGLAIEARPTETVETVLARFVVAGRLLSARDFTELRGQELFTTSWEDVKGRLIEELGPERVINHRDKATEFVREYMRRLTPSLPNAEPNARALLKAIVNAMALNQNYSATEFVRQFILEENPIRISELRSSIETYRSVNATIVILQRKLAALQDVRVHVSEFEQSLHRRALEEWLQARARWLAARAENRALLSELADADRQIAANEEDRAVARECVEDAEKEIDRLNKAIAAHAAQSGRDLWEQQLRRSERERESSKVQVSRLVRAVAELAHVAGDAGVDVNNYCRLAARGELADLRELKQAEATIAPHAAGIRDGMLERSRALGRQLSVLVPEIQRLKEALAPGGDRLNAAYLSEETRRLVRRLESMRIDARPLCDLVEIVDPEWTAAAEALLGRDREAVFVDRSRIADATLIFREGRREFRGASLVSLNKLEAYRSPPAPGSFPALFRAQDLDAMAFLQRRYGTVRLATTMEEFNRPGRALMTDGLYDDGLVRSHRSISAADHKIGRSAQATLLQRMGEDLAEKGEQFEKLSVEERRLTQAATALASLFEDGALRLSSMLEQLASCAADARDASDKIAAIDASGDGGLRERRNEQERFRKLKAAELKSIEDRNSKHATRRAIAEHKLGGTETQPGSRNNMTIAVGRYRQRKRLFDYRQGNDAYRERLRQWRRGGNAGALADPASAARREAAAHNQIQEKAEEARGRENDRNRRAELAAQGALRDYFNTPEFGVSSQVGPESPLLTDIKPWMNTLIADIEANELRRYEAQAREASERASVLFRGEFVNALMARISKMERDLESLNRSLRPHPFHNERYSFHRTPEAEFQPILKIIEISRMSDDALDMLFRQDLPEDYPHKDTIKAVEQLLEDREKDVTAFEDYRNFYAFEIHMEDIVSGSKTRWETRRNTGSGAEQQVPLYVAIGASLAAVYGSSPQLRGAKGMSPALFDEAFSKMDGKNQRAMMSFYAELGLQVIVAAPLEKKAAIIGYMETLVEIDRIGNQSSADVFRVGKRTRDELLAMNPEHMSDAEIAKRMAAE